MAVATVDTPLFCCPSIISQALRAAIVAAELPLRGKLRAGATTFSIDQRILEVICRCFRALLIQGPILWVVGSTIQQAATQVVNWARNLERCLRTHKHKG